MDAIGKKYPGNSGLEISSNVDASIHRDDAILQRLGSLSTLDAADPDALPKRDANSTPPNCPMPSFIIQLNAAEAGAAVAEPTPTANKRDCVDRTMAADPAQFAKKQ
mmetsp:Transcript_37918/g.56752  ORF Transcript_37918/g.56752 Transcript_37918/m.56752 type:complete len:107 (+) Transcript_37918:2348-2668(+)